MLITDAAPGFASCHASTLVETAAGTTVAAWFGGTKEGHTDVAVWSSVLENGQWSSPQVIADHPGEPLWNPVLFRHDNTLLLMYRVGKRIPDWRSCLKRSDDGGRTWSEAEPLPDAFLGPIKNKPIRTSEGLWLCGSSVETGSEWYARMELYDADADRWTHAVDLHLAGNHGIIQPSVWESAPGDVHALMRSNMGRIVRSDSSDGGRSWTEPTPTILPNNNSGIDVARTPDACLVLCCNPIDQNWGKRSPLVLLASDDNGISWPRQVVLEDSDGEFSYPAIIATQDGVAVTYTHKREAIAYRRVSIDEIQTPTAFDEFTD